MSRGAHQIIGLQYLRGVAALGVVVGHTSVMAGFPKYFGVELGGGVLRHGAVGVDLFFLLSGFIIATVSLDTSLQPRIAVSEYFRRRAVRILPLLWLAVGSYAALRLLGRGSFDAGPYVRAALLLPWGDVAPNVVWTLRHEAIFYSLFALTFLTGRSWTRWLILAWVAAPLAYAAPSLPAEPSSAWMQAVRIFTHPVNVEFGAGLLIGLLWRVRPGKPLSLPVDPALLFPVLFAALLGVAALLNLNFQSVWSTLITAALCAPILFLGLRAVCPPTLLGRVMRLLGDASYAIYLFHLHLVSAILGVWSKLAPSTPIWLVVVPVACLATCGGILVHLIIEKPVLALLGRGLKSHRARAAVPALG